MSHLPGSRTVWSFAKNRQRHQNLSRPALSEEVWDSWANQGSQKHWNPHLIIIPCFMSSFTVIISFFIINHLHRTTYHPFVLILPALLFLCCKPQRSSLYILFWHPDKGPLHCNPDGGPIHSFVGSLHSTRAAIRNP